MADGSTQTLVFLTAAGVAVGGVNSLGNSTSRATLAAETASSRVVAISTSTGALRAWTATGGAASTLAPTMQLITASGAGVTGAASITGPPAVMQYITAFGIVNPLSDSQVVTQRWTAAGTVLTGSLGSSRTTVQAIVGASYGGPSSVGSSSVALRYVLAAGTAFAGTGATFAAVVLQTQLQALTTYSNFFFNSLARFNGDSIGASDQGLFVLTAGADDDGTPIQAAARLALSDLNSSFRKRIERAYVGYRSPVDMVLRVYTDETKQRDYRIPGNGATGLHGAHVRLGRGLEARYWQFEVRNQNGADFSLNVIEVKPTKLERRVGGADA